MTAGKAKPFNVVDGKRTAYVAATEEDSNHTTWGVSICIEGEPGHRPLPDYSGYKDEARTQGIADRLNARMGVTPEEARDIVRTTIIASTKEKTRK